MRNGRRPFISSRDVRRTAAAQSRRALTGSRLVAHILAANEIDRAELAHDRVAFAQFQLQEVSP